MRILIVEDLRPMALGLAEVLQLMGHSVLCVVGFRSLAPILAIDLDGQDQTIHPDQFDLVLSDGQLEQFCDGGKQIQGVDVVQRFTGLGSLCIGISSADSINSELLANGAKFAGNKTVVFLAILGKVFNLEDVATKSQQCAAKLSAFKSSSQDNQSLKDQGDAILKKYL
ncbi:MAG: hypothetical protein K2X93_20975 [Candidatus Obscuribacterales bacterium]|nr:hypothetical protein [Candidatus Obscuribacterales bacterium]